MGSYDFSGNLIADKTNTWKGRSASFLGDSITYGVKTDKVYWLYLQDMLELSHVYGYGVDGSRISSGNNPMYGRIDSINNNSDVVFLFGGTNDFHASVPLGEFYTTENGTRIFDETVTTFRGALNHTLLMLKNKFPSKQIVIMTPLHRSNFSTQKTDMETNGQGLYLEDYVNTIREAASIFSVNLIDLYRDSGLFPYNQANANLYFNVGISDKLHPNTKGHERIAQVIAAKMLTIPCIS